MVALWHYWRWRIESYFKLLKSAGLQLEEWQQATAELAGLWVLPAMLDVLDHYTITDLRRAAAVCFPALKQIGFV
jgi:hypothetical protein